MATSLNINQSTISAWENEELEITLTDAKLICDYFKIPNAYFVFGESFDKIDNNTKRKITEYLINIEYLAKIQEIIENCRQKLKHDGIIEKAEFLPIFNQQTQQFESFGLFIPNSIPVITKEVYTNRGQFPDLIGSFNSKTHLSSHMQNHGRNNTGTYSYSTAALAEYGLFDVLQKTKGKFLELKDLTKCNNVDVFKMAIDKMRERRYQKELGYYPGAAQKDVTEEVIQEQLNKVLEHLNPSMSHFWEIIVFLIDEGAFYTKDAVCGGDVTEVNEVKDISKTNLVYRMAKDIIDKKK